MVGFIFFIIIFSLISGVLATQIAESTLILRVKQFLYLDQPYSKKLFALGKFKTWWSLLPRFFIILLPLISVLILVILVIKLHHFISELLDCPYCTSFHIMWLLCYFYMGTPIILSLLLGCLGIIGTYIIYLIK
jgi:hypothetical protein